MSEYYETLHGVEASCKRSRSFEGLSCLFWNLHSRSQVLPIRLASSWSSIRSDHHIRANPSGSVISEADYRFLKLAGRLRVVKILGSILMILTTKVRESRSRYFFGSPRLANFMLWLHMRKFRDGNKSSLSLFRLFASQISERWDLSWLDWKLICFFSVVLIITCLSISLIQRMKNRLVN